MRSFDSCMCNTQKYVYGLMCMQWCFHTAIFVRVYPLLFRFLPVYMSITCVSRSVILVEPTYRAEIYALIAVASSHRKKLSSRKCRRDFEKQIPVLNPTALNFLSLTLQWSVVAGFIDINGIFNESSRTTCSLITMIL